MGFELNLYSDLEYSIVFFILDYLYTLSDKNSRSFIVRYDRDFLKAWQSKQGLDKKKKKLSDFQKKFFYKSIFQKAIESYIRSMMKLVHGLQKRGLIKNYYENDKEAYEKRFYSRLKVFENIFFIKKLEFSDYLKLLNQIGDVDVILINIWTISNKVFLFSSMQI